MNKKISVIIPVFNEEQDILNCLTSISGQTYKNLEIIIIDDGSTDQSVEIIKKFPVLLFHQDHLGAASARNLGASKSTGKILVFVDADMVFSTEFIDKLTKPIRQGKTIGTFSKDELLLNKNKIWSRCWNLNKRLPINRMHARDYPNTQEVFRAILKKSFEQVKGFDSVGYVDDHSLYQKLNVKATLAKGATFYHKNPESLVEIYQQARWIGKSEYKYRRIKNELLMKFISLIRYSLPFSLLNGLLISVVSFTPQFILFKLVYDFAIEVSLIKSFFGEQIYK